MTPEFFIQTALDPALKLLPVEMDTPAARAMLIAIALQESRIEHRKQIGGPARGYWQFEQGGGVCGVLTHAASKPHIQSVLAAMDYAQDSGPEACYEAIAHNDILATCFARLLLYTLPDAMPARNAPGKAWSIYVSGWRPGKPHRDTFDAFYDQAWELVS